MNTDANTTGVLDGAPATDTDVTNGTNNGVDNADTAGGGQGESAGEGAAKDAASEPQLGAPEQYEDFQLPEGFELEGDRLEQTRAWAKENNLSQEQAQAAINRFCEMGAEQSQSFQQKLVEQNEAWGKELATRFGSEYSETISDAQRALRALDADGTVKGLINQYGLGNNPDLVGLFAKVGKALGGAKLNGLGGETAATEDVPITQVMYPNDYKK